MIVRRVRWRPGLARLGVGRLLLAAAALALLLASCSKGTYQVEIFPEQHYQQSFKKQEPPRLAPPDGAVPITGREVALDLETATKTPNPLPRTTEVLAGAAELFRVNCSMCHGSRGQGDGPVGAILVRDGYSSPPDLTAPVTQDKAEGHIFWLISNGVVVMPKFSLLIDEEGRWALVHYLRYLAQQGQ